LDFGEEGAATFPPNENRLRCFIHDVWGMYFGSFSQIQLMDYQYDAGVLGGVLLHKPFLDAIGNPKGVYVIPMITASYDLAAFIAAIAIAPFTFRLGRRWTISTGAPRSK
jgi:hypothetical protein